MLDHIEMARREAINKIRAEAAEANQAFNAVMSLRAKLAEVGRALEAALSDPRNPASRARRLEAYITELAHKLVEAETYCRQVNAAQLCDHDLEVQRLAEVARQARERQEAEGQAREECQQRSASRRLEQLSQRARQEAEARAVSTLL
jgi:hypothetical protein